MPKRYIWRLDGTLIEDNGVTVDSSLAIADAAVDAKAVGDALIKKLNADRLNSVVYLCVRNTGAAVHHALADLAGLYVESVNNDLY